MDSAIAGWVLATINVRWLQVANAGTITVPHRGAVRQERLLIAAYRPDDRRGLFLMWL